MQRGNSASLTRVYNRAVVLDALRRHRSLSRVELARFSGLTPQAIRNIVEDLIRAELIRETGRRHGGRGQPQIDMEINPDGGYSVGLHIEAGLARAIATNLLGEVIYDLPARPFPHDRAGMIEFVHDLDETFSRTTQQIRRLGVGVVVSRPLAAPWSIGGEPVVEFEEQFEVLAHQFGDDIVFENDANAAAMAERLHASTFPGDDFLYLFVGEGVGGGIIGSGRPYRGVRGNAAEFGHLPVDPGGRRCFCGNRGCLHGFLSLADLRKQFPGVDISHRDLVPNEWLTGAIRALSIAVHTLENVFDPNTIVIGGTAPQWLLQELAARVDPGPSVRSNSGEPRLRVSALGGNCALLGAAALPLLEQTSPHPDKLMKSSINI